MDAKKEQFSWWDANEDECCRPYENDNEKEYFGDDLSEGNNDTSSNDDDNDDGTNSDSDRDDVIVDYNDDDDAYDQCYDYMEEKTNDANVEKKTIEYVDAPPPKTCHWLSKFDAPVELDPVEFPTSKEASHIPQSPSSDKSPKKFVDERESNIKIVKGNKNKINFVVKKTTPPPPVVVKQVARPRRPPPIINIIKKTELCPNAQKGQKCLNNNCIFYHPKRVASKKHCDAEPRHSTRLWFCKNLILYGRCKFENDCRFAHHNWQVAKEVTACKYGQNCTFILLAKNGKYTNNGVKRCIRLHEGETISNFVVRMQEELHVAKCAMRMFRQSKSNIYHTEAMCNQQNIKQAEKKDAHPVKPASSKNRPLNKKKDNKAPLA